MKLEELEAMRPAIEEIEKKQKTEFEAERNKLDLLLRACDCGLIPPPKRARHWWMPRRCPKCGTRLLGSFNYLRGERLFHMLCDSEACGYEFLTH